jgi:hypothetical protein
MRQEWLENLAAQHGWAWVAANRGRLDREWAYIQTL